MSYTQRNIYDIKYGKAILEGDKNSYCFTYVDAEFAGVTGYSRSELSEMRFCDIVPEEDREAFDEKIASVSGIGDDSVFEGSLVIKEGYTKRFLFYLKRLEDGIHIMATKHDYAQRSGIAYEDITAMFSVMGTQQVKEEIDEFLAGADKEKEHHFMLIDMDNYVKFLNSYGHQFVGTVLKNITAGLIRVFKNTDIIMGRVSEDITVAFFPNADIKVTAEYASRVQEVFKRTYMGAREYGMNADCKIGISKAFKDGATFEELSSKAQIALDYAKRHFETVGIYSENIEISPMYKEIKFGEFESIDSDNYERGFVAFASSLIVHSRNLDCSINLLLECVGRNFGINTVLINEYNPESKMMCISNYWDNINGIRTDKFEENDYNEWEGFISGFDKNGFMFIEDTSKVDSEKDRAWFKAVGIRSCVNCVLYDNSRMLGYISFCVNDDSKKWTKTELATLLELSKIVAMAVALRRNDKYQMDMYEEDDITGLLTYQAFIRRAQEIISQGGKDIRYAVIYADINNFAYVNDNFGFFEGNKLLAETGERLNAIKNSISCRPGADRFVTFVRIVENDDEIVNELKKMFDELDERFVTQFPMSDLSMTAGISYMTSGIDDVLTTIENANSTRKALKEDNTAEGVGVYTPELREKRQREMEIIGSVYQAIEDGSIIAYLQPKVSISERKVIGAEALVRWKKKDGSIRFPGDFIPILEKVGYIVDVDFCVYEQVLKLLVEWKKKGYELLPVSVNFSRVHLKYAGFEERINALAKKYDIDPEYIEIEVTESMFASDVLAAIKCLGKLRDFGFKIDIDDFGTGYSSLNTLVETPADVVKIDKCFVDKTDTEAGRNYTRRIAEVAVASNKAPVFEGVETEEQARFLLDNGYDVAQGYLFSKPIEIAEFEEKYMKSR